jgi:hypothetical protein
MSTEAYTSSTPAARMRRYRRRRRQGLHYVRIPLHVTEIDTLIRMGLLTEEQRQDEGALRKAIRGIVYAALDDFGIDCFCRPLLKVE